MLPKLKEQRKLPCRLVAQTGGAEAEFIGQSELYFGGHFMHALHLAFGKSGL